MAALASVALISCSEQHAPAQQSATGALGYESPGPVMRAPLAPPSGYAAPLPAPGQGETAGPQAAPGWQPSPRWAAIKGQGCIEVEPDPRAGAAGQPGMKIERCGDGAEAAPRDQVELAPQDDVDPSMPAPE